MRKIASILIAALGTLLAAMPLLAHHAFTAEFDANQQLKLQGKVVKIELINPHTWIHIDVKADNGELTRWMIEAGTPNTLLRRGLTKATLPIGAEVIVDGFRAKDGSNRANGRHVTLVDGRTIFLGGTSPDAPPEK